MSNGNLTLELIVDVPADQVAQTKQDYESEGYRVEVKQQASGKFSIAAAKCD